MVRTSLDPDHQRHRDAADPAQHRLDHRSRCGSAGTADDDASTFRGKVALVTGAGRGLGFAIAEALHAAGATVAVNDRTPECVRRSDRAARRRDAADPRPRRSPRRGRRRRRRSPRRHAAGGIDLLVNNAAVNVEKPIEETDDAHWDLHLAVVLKASFFTVAGGACRCSRQAAAQSSTSPPSSACTPSPTTSPMSPPSTASSR